MMAEKKPPAEPEPDAEGRRHIAAWIEVSEEDYAILKRLADEAGVSVARWYTDIAIDALQNELEKRGLLRD
jgi:hypothetical protein